jgi:hypothetical protein
MVVLVDTPGMTADQYDQVVSEAGMARSLPSGCRAHVAGPMPDGSGWRVVSVWDDLATAQDFIGKKIRPSQERLGVAVPTGPPQIWECHNLVV